MIGTIESELSSIGEHLAEIAGSQQEIATAIPNTAGHFEILTVVGGAIYREPVLYWEPVGRDFPVFARGVTLFWGGSVTPKTALRFPNGQIIVGVRITGTEQKRFLNHESDLLNSAAA
jgi:hypothetical protein